MSLIILFAAGAFLLVAVWVAQSIRVSNLFHNPLIYPIFFFVLQYPIRSILVVVAPDLLAQVSIASIHPADYYLLGLLFATIFLALLGISLRLFCPFRMRCLAPVHPAAFAVSRFGGRSAWLIHSVAIVYLLTFVYQASTGAITGLYEDFEQLLKGRMEFFLGEIVGLRWFIATMCAVAFMLTGRFIFFAEAMLIIFTVIVAALLTTSKGQILNIGIFILLVTAVSGRRVPYGRITILAVATILFGAMSYEIREVAYFEVRGFASPLELIEKYHAALFNINLFALLQKHWLSVLDRVTYYGDALAVMLSAPPKHGEGPYVMGSLVELGNLVPRTIWVDRPHLSFNHYVTGAVWGIHGVFSEMPIGRIGEAFYVAGWLGVGYGIVYGALFAGLCLFWRKARQSVWGSAAWVGVVMAWVVPDAYLTYGLKQVIVVCCVAYGLGLLSKIPGSRWGAAEMVLTRSTAS